MSRPISLSQEQLEAVMQASKLLPYEWRGRFISAIADQLVESEGSDRDVQQAVQRVLDRIGMRAP